MKLALKTYGIIMLVVISLVAIDGYIFILRDIEWFEDTAKKDLHLLGTMIRKIVVDIWKREGLLTTLQVIKEINDKKQHVQIRWISMNALPDGPHAPSVSQNKFRPVTLGKEKFFKQVGTGVGSFCYYLPVSIKGNVGAIEISKSRVELVDCVKERIRRVFMLSGWLVVSSALVLYFISDRIIRRPLVEIMEKTRRIGQGDYLQNSVVCGKNELTELDISINEMCKQIVSAQESVHREADGRVAAIKQLRHTERLSTVGRLASGMAHELGTPLNIVGGRAKMIIDENLSREEMINYARIISGQVVRMTKIIRELLDFARRRKTCKSLVNIRKIVKEVCNILEITARNNGVTLTSTIDCNVGPIMMDEFQIQQVLVNVVMNGIHAMPDGGQIEISINIQDGASPIPGNDHITQFLVIVIKDEGKGIHREHLPHIFEPFYTTKSIGKGTGLGLSISYGIVQEHDGWIEAKSEVGRGTCITIYLPK